MDWLSLEDAARMLGVDVRSVYRMIGRGELQTSGEKRGRKVLLSSVEALLTKRLAENATKDIDSGAVSQESGQESKGLARNDNRAAVMALSAIQNDRDKLYDRLEALHELRRQESIESAKLIGQLQERVRNLEAQLEAGQALPPAQGDSVAASVTDNTPRPAPVPTAAPGESAVKPPWWRRLFG